MKEEYWYSIWYDWGFTVFYFSDGLPGIDKGNMSDYFPIETVKTISRHLILSDLLHRDKIDKLHERLEYLGCVYIGEL